MSDPESPRARSPGRPGCPGCIRGARGRRAGRATLLALLLLAGLFAAFCVHGLRLRRAAASPEPPEPEVLVDPRDLVWEHLPEWADARWAEELRAGMEELPALRPGDAAGLEGWRARLAAFSFVREVTSLHVHADGRVELALELRLPVACIPAGDLYYPVADDGTVLSGAWNVPPRVRGRWLPVIGPLADGRGLFDRSRPGDFLVLDEHVAALDVALSLQEQLSAEEAERLGRLVVDASRVAETSVAEPGIRLLLEERRLALFGRPPWSGAPGELPAARKWRALLDAYALLDPAREEGVVDWDVVDLRWDRPGLVPRGEALLLAAAQEAGAAAAPRAAANAATQAGRRVPVPRSEDPPPAPPPPRRATAGRVR